jgi:hypothetical protein
VTIGVAAVNAAFVALPPPPPLPNGGALLPPNGFAFAIAVSLTIMVMCN